MSPGNHQMWELSINGCKHHKRRDYVLLHKRTHVSTYKVVLPSTNTRFRQTNTFKGLYSVGNGRTDTLFNK